MTYKRNLLGALLVLGTCGGVLMAQGTAPDAKSGPAKRRMILDAVVTDAGGKPVTGLTATDFTLTDNGQATPIAGFQAVNAAINGAKVAPKVPTEVTIVLDTVNAITDDVSYERAQLDIYLRKNPKLDFPTTILVFNEYGAKPIAPASTDGNSLADAVEKIDANLRPYRTSQGFYGGLERMQLSTGTLSTLALEAGKRPGRKVVLWLGQGWPLLQDAEARIDAKQSKKLFETIVALSTELRAARMVLYALDTNRVPGDQFSNGLEANEVDSHGSRQADWLRYTAYNKPVVMSKMAAVGDISVQVLALQSGGLPVNSPKQVLSDQLADVITMGTQGYVLLFDATPSSQKDEFHSLKVTVNKPGVTVYSRVGYYDQP